MRDAPAGWQATSEGGEISLARRWRTTGRTHIALAALGLAVAVSGGALMVGWGPEYAASGSTFWASGRRNREPVNRRVMGFVVLATAPLLGYLFAAKALNTTWISVGPQGLTVRHGPLPWPAPRAFEAKEVKQLYGEEMAVVQGASTFRVCALIRDHHRPLTLVDDLRSPGEVLFVERSVEAALGIEDRKVSGEMNQK